VAAWQLSLQHGGEQRRWRVRAEGRSLLFEDGQRVVLLGPDRVSVDGVQRRLVWHREGVLVRIASDAAVFAFHEPSAHPAPAAAADPLRARAPVAGLVAQLLVKVGDAVVEGQALLSVEAMKMEMWLVAGATGRVKAVHAALREAVAAGAVLVELEA
jgi:geranyl-CoA carboxylase alpha subunit